MEELKETEKGSLVKFGGVSNPPLLHSNNYFFLLFFTVNNSGRVSGQF